MHVAPPVAKCNLANVFILFICTFSVFVFSPQPPLHAVPLSRRGFAHRNTYNLKVTLALKFRNKCGYGLENVQLSTQVCR